MPPIIFEMIIYFSSHAEEGPGEAPQFARFLTHMILMHVKPSSSIAEFFTNNSKKEMQMLLEVDITQIKTGSIIK